MIPNAHFILKLMETVVKGAVMKISRRILPIYIYMTMLEEELYIICTRKNMIWPEMFKRFIDDGFGIIKSNKKQFSRWVEEFDNLRENIFIDKWTFGN